VKRRKIEIENRTHWRTADLRRFAVRAANDVFEPGEKPLLRLRVVYGRKYVTGCAGIGGIRSTIRIPKREVDRRALALVLVHEFGHNRGLEHRQMHGSRWDWVADWRERYAWGETLPLEPRPVKRRERVTGIALAESRREKVAALLQSWQRRLKRAQTAVRKCQRRLRYYDKRTAALRPQTVARQLP
jgi:hypothetical protein